MNMIEPNLFLFERNDEKNNVRDQVLFYEIEKGWKDEKP